MPTKKYFKYCTGCLCDCKGIETPYYKRDCYDPDGDDERRERKQRKENA